MRLYLLCFLLMIPTSSVRAEGQAPANENGGVLDTVKGWFSGDKKNADTSKPSDEKCPAEPTKSKFVPVCEAYKTYLATSSNQPVDGNRIKESCRCIASKFTVQDATKPPYCNFSFDDIRVALSVDAIRTNCE